MEILRRLGFALLLVTLCVGEDAFAETVRYFAVWSYVENAPAEEIAPEALSKRKLGYWALEFDQKGRVLAGTYHIAGAPWLRLHYVAEGGRVYADLYGPNGQLLSRKSTQVSDRFPHWSE